METSTMGRVLVSGKIENLSDYSKMEEGTLPADQVRSVEVSEAWWIRGRHSCPCPDDSSTNSD